MFRIVSHGGFQDFIRNYPRPLEAHPPLNRKARFRTFRDPTLGDWPDNVVAKQFMTTPRSAVYEINTVPD